MIYSSFTQKSVRFNKRTPADSGTDERYEEKHKTCQFQEVNGWRLQPITNVCRYSSEEPCSKTRPALLALDHHISWSIISCIQCLMFASNTVMVRLWKIILWSVKRENSGHMISPLSFL